MKPRDLFQEVHHRAHLLLHGPPDWDFDGYFSDAWYVKVSGQAAKGPEGYIAAGVSDEMERTLKRVALKAKLVEALGHLREYNAVAHYAITRACLPKDAARLWADGYFRHCGRNKEVQEALRQPEDALWRTLRNGWGLLAVLLSSWGVVEVEGMTGDDLMAWAERTERVDRRALEWARERGLL